jgi:hypothetical protein
MIHESTIDASMNRLMAHFGAQVVFRPPASAADVAALAAEAGPLPRDLTIFLATCNGLRLEVEVLGVPRRIWSVHDMLHALRGADGIGLPAGLVPVLGQADDEVDCVVAASGPARDVVIRWDASAPGAAVIASSFERYFDAWTRFVVERTLASPRQRTRMYFGAEFIGRRDAELATLRRDRRVEEWLRALDVAVACGDDFE